MLLATSLSRFLPAATAFSGSVVSSTRSPASALVGAATRLMSATTTTSTTDLEIIPRVKTAAATEASEGPVLVKGWVRTVRKQKTLAFVEVNDGSNLSGIQCVVPFDAIDETTKAGKKFLSRDAKC